MDIGNVLISSTPSDVLTSLTRLFEVNIHSFNHSLKMAIIHGSIVKGGFIPGYSDIDIQFWLSSSLTFFIFFNFYILIFSIKKLN